MSQWFDVLLFWWLIYREHCTCFYSASLIKKNFVPKMNHSDSDHSPPGRINVRKLVLIASPSQIQQSPSKAPRGWKVTWIWGHSLKKCVCMYRLSYIILFIYLLSFLWRIVGVILKQSSITDVWWLSLSLNASTSWLQEPLNK